ncbi:MAG: uracil-DNA glycosylase [Defluviitaleaceae bacterium]|nr:uracil-DNA glycosylase [Defluviitaleaceae bacterium]
MDSAKWQALENECAACRKCGLSQERSNVVFGVGSRQSKLMLVGEGPGYHEDMQGEPFVGPAGQLLDKMLASVGLLRKDVYIANVVKCRPPNNRDPQPAEMEACLPYLRAQYTLLRPGIIVCLGRISAGALIDKEFRITRDRGKWFERKGVAITATFHPAALLRDDSKKRPAWEDFKVIKRRLEELKN